MSEKRNPSGLDTTVKIFGLIASVLAIASFGFYLFESAARGLSRQANAITALADMDELCKRQASMGPQDKLSNAVYEHLERTDREPIASLRIEIKKYLKDDQGHTGKLRGEFDRMLASDVMTIWCHAMTSQFMTNAFPELSDLLDTRAPEVTTIIGLIGEWATEESATFDSIREELAREYPNKKDVELAVYEPVIKAKIAAWNRRGP